ncbi:hypothetical protein Gorai_006333 [Gossypium raimondii]|uniref:Uncharacterized protein n=1 Tax=Gossypium raimondii TaxID=29730 RepID=A0A7J8QEZ2_GOSRA|nr:hypothetical protein [Gossypium raimondii]
MVSRVAKLDFSMDSRTRGHFARMAMYVHLDKPLIFMVRSEDQTSPPDMSMVEVDAMKGSEAYRPWMLVEKKSKRKPRELQRSGVKNQDWSSTVGGNSNSNIKGKGTGEKIEIGKGGKKLNKTLRGCRSRFKMTESSQVLLTYSMNYIVKLITSQLEIEIENGDLNEAEKRPEDTIVTE